MGAEFFMPRPVRTSVCRGIKVWALAADPLSDRIWLGIDASLVMLDQRSGKVKDVMEVHPRSTYRPYPRPVVYRERIGVLDRALARR